MKKITFFILIINVTLIFSQTKSLVLEGKISYISSTNVYVKFLSTDGIEEGDTLFKKIEQNLSPAIIVKYISSVSCAGEKIDNIELKVGDILSAKIKSENDEIPQKESEAIIIAATDSNKIASTAEIDENVFDGRGLEGRIAVSSYANLSNTRSTDYMRWRYTLSMNSENISNSNLSLESYISFNYRSTDWQNVKDNFGRALKIYSLAAKYDFNEKTSLTIGRKINPNVTNISSVDGIQLETKFNEFQAGLIVGSRPNFSDFGYNFKLFEFGGYISHNALLGEGSISNSLALFQQTNDFKTDRRFIYFQHRNNIIKKISLFVSSEIDLYDGSSAFSLTGVYLSLRYRPGRIVNFQVSYDARKNVIYYETFKNYADSLLESATRQGFRFRVNLRPVNYLSMSGSFGYRYREGDIRPTKNYSGNITYSRMPLINSSISFGYNYLYTGYLKGNIAGIRLSRDIIPGYLFGSFNYRIVNYVYVTSQMKLDQTNIGFDLSWNLMDKLLLSLSYESTFEEKQSYSRILMNITKRF